MEEEKVLGVIPNNYLKKGLFKVERYNLIITNKRLIGARITNELLKQESAERVEKTKEEGRGKMKQFFAKLGTNFTFYKRYLDMNPEDILNETEDNLSFTPDVVSGIRLRKGKVYYDSDGDMKQNPHSLLIQSKGKKYNFSFNGDIANARNLLYRVFGRV